jgi:ubiquinone/menaquinone biosynthesis C-methylase UbiE
MIEIREIIGQGEMFNNFINRYDFSRLLWGLRHGYFKKILRRFTKPDRAKQYWSEEKTAVSSWWMIPEIGRHTNLLISGNEKTDYFSYVSQKYLKEKQNLIALSLGCGNGHRELKWAKLANFARIDAYDLSPTLIETARKNAAQANLEKSIHYEARDITTCQFADGTYDVVFVEQSLHHFSSLDTFLKQIKRAMKPDGLFIINEFIGPIRFQWTKRQLEIANALRTLMPPEFRRHIVDHSPNHKIIRPSRFSMIMKDPSEAIESSKIVPLLREIFETVEYRPYHGALTQILFDGIAHNFIDNPFAKPLIKICLDLEKYLTETGQLDSDYALIICRPASARQ